MKPVSYLDGRVTLYQGDCLRVLDTMPENSVDAVCCDPPYHLASVIERFAAPNAAAPKAGKSGAFKRVSAGFMGKKWDGGDIAFRTKTWAKVLRVLKPGGYIIAFASARGYGRMQVAMEGAGFITHPMIGELLSLEPRIAQFLSSLSAEQAGAFLQLIDGADPIGLMGWIFGSGFPKATRVKAEGFDGFRYGGQSLKPALEPIYMGQKPFSEETGTGNILAWGTGAVNIDGSRIATSDGLKGSGSAPYKFGGTNPRPFHDTSAPRGTSPDAKKGRWPANVIHDGSDAVIAEFPAEAGAVAPVHRRNSDKLRHTYGAFQGNIDEAGSTFQGDSGSAARFFYAGKASALDRAGLKHPTVKPLDPVQYLVRLITPPGGLVLDPFAGTGTTGEAAWREGMRAILIEKDKGYCEDIARRMHLAENPSKRAAIVKAKGKLRGAEETPLFEAAE